MTLLPPLCFSLNFDNLIFIVSLIVKSTVGHAPLKRSTISDVAVRAGVSKSTVSHALSGKRSISPATRQRILAAIKEIDYRPSAVAQRLAGGGKTRNLGLVFPLMSPTIRGIETQFIVSAAVAASLADYTFLFLAHFDGDLHQFERVATSGLVDGLVLMGVHLNDARVAILNRERVPFVLLGRCANNDGISFVDVDIEQGMVDCVGHLAQQGHRTIAYFHHTLDADFGFAMRSWSAFFEQCKHYGITPIVEQCPPTLEGGEQTMDLLLQRIQTQGERLPTAVIMRIDTVAQGVMHSALKAGLGIPHDLSIVSLCYSDDNLVVDPAFATNHSNSETRTNQATLRLTALDIHADQLGAMATRLMIEQLEGEVAQPRQVLIKPNLVIGETTAPAKQLPQI